MKKKLITPIVVVVLLAIAVAFWLLRPQPSRVALVNFPQFMVARMSLSADAKNVSVDVVDDLSTLKKYDAVLCFGMGAKWSEEDRAQITGLDEKKIPYLVLMATNPENNLCSIDSAKAEVLSRYFSYGGAKNYKSGFNYLRQEILEKPLREGKIGAPIEYANDLFFGKTDEYVFESKDEYMEYYRSHGYREGAPRVALLVGFGNPFNSNREHIDEIVAALEKSGLNVFPFSAGSKRLEFLESIDPHILIYMPHGRLAAGRSTEAEAWLRKQNIPVLAPLTIGSLREEWEENQQGMIGGFLAQSVSTPELDGAMVPFALVALEKDEKTGLQLFKTIPGRLEVFTNLVNKYIALKSKPNKDKRVAIYYFKGPGQNSLVAQGIETLPSLYNTLRHMQSEGYDLTGLPQDEATFARMMMTQGAIFNSYAEGNLAKFASSGYPAFVPVDDLSRWMQEVLTPRQIQLLHERYGEAPGEYFAMERQGKKGIGVTRVQFGNVVLLPQPIQSTGINDFKAVHGSNPVPPYSYVASYLWTQKAFKADVLMHFGTHGSLEFIPGKQIALSSEDWTDRLVNDLPHIYYYTIANVGEGMIAKRRSYAATVSYLAPPFIETRMRGQVSEFLNLTDRYLGQETDDIALALRIKALAVRSGYHRDLKLDSALSVPYTREQIASLSDFAEELAVSKIPGGMYKTGIPFPEEKIRSSVLLIASDPIAYALAALDRERGVYTQKQQDSERFFSLHYRRPAQALVERYMGGRPVDVDAALRMLSVTQAEVAQSAAVVDAAAAIGASMHEQMMAAAGGRMPTSSEMAMMRKMGEQMRAAGGQGPDSSQIAAMRAMAARMKAEGGSGPDSAAMAAMRAMGASKRKASEGKAHATADSMPATHSGRMEKSAAPSIHSTRPQSGKPAPDKASISAENKAMAVTINELKLAIARIPHYYESLRNSPQLELKAMMNALAGGYTSPTPGGDFIANPETLPTGRNLFAINAEATPSAAAWEKGKKLAEDMLADYARNHDGKLPSKVSFTLWSSSFIESEGATIAEILYLLGTEPVRDRMGRVQDIRLIPLEELGRKRIDVVVQTSGQLRDLAASRLYLIQKAVDLAASQKSERDNEVVRGAVDAEKVLLEKGLSPADARMLATQRVFGGVNGNYGTGIQGMVESGDRWETEKEIADTYLNNMGAIYGMEGRWGDFQQGMFEAALQNVDVVVQPRQSNTWGALSLDHVYEFMGGLSLTVRQVTGKDPDAYFNDLRSKHKTRVQELKQAIGVEARTTILNPTYIQEQLKEGANAANGIAETIRNTYGWNVMKPAAIDKELWEDIYATYIRDEKGLGVQEFFRTQNPAALQELTAVMMETARKGLWKASPEQLRTLAEMHAASMAEAGAGCSGFVCDNAKLRAFIGERLSGAQKQSYDNKVAEARQAAVKDGAKGQRLKKETLSSDSDTTSATSYLLPVGVALVVIILIIFLVAKRRKSRE
ncbi:cobaltochelatase subunit CobN [Porphyromonas loveana]|uniref:cobaltochelatase subunit CobN n=2 Tax=Porphyromonas loveana TaxID=1884669 RepID=UPI0035A0BB82